MYTSIRLARLLHMQLFRYTDVPEATIKLLWCVRASVLVMEIQFFFFCNPILLLRVLLHHVHYVTNIRIFFQLKLELNHFYSLRLFSGFLFIKNYALYYYQIKNINNVFSPKRRVTRISITIALDISLLSLIIARVKSTVDRSIIVNRQPNKKKKKSHHSPIGEAVLASRRLTVSGSMPCSSSSMSGGGGAKLREAS